MSGAIVHAMSELHAARTMLAAAPTPIHASIARMLIAQAMATLATLTSEVES